MYRRLLFSLLAVVLVLALAGCHKGKAQKATPEVDSKQPDSVLYARGVDLIKRKKYDAARMSLNLD